MSEPAPRKAGMPWYEREDYPQILALVEDPHVLAPVYDQWLAAARNNEQEAERAGVAVVRVPIKPEVLRRWCTERGLVPDGRARMRFVTEAMERDA